MRNGLYSSLFTKTVEKKNNTNTIKSDRKANNLTKQIKICKHFPIQFIIYSSINQLITKKSDAIKEAAKACVIGYRMTYILYKNF